jgi:hypothetical protein
MAIDVGSGSVRLDFRQAVIAVPELRIDVQMASGSLKLVTRPGIEVTAADVAVGSGSVTVIPAGGLESAPRLRVKVAGRVASGSILARPAAQNWWRALWRRLLRR